jgi:hypothetical protein
VPDLPDDRYLGGAGNRDVVLAVDFVAVGDRSAGPSALGGLAFHTVPGPVDEDLAFELGETPSIWTSMRPAADEVSNGSVADRKWTSICSSSSMR